MITRQTPSYWETLRLGTILFGVILLIGCAIRIGAATRGFNYDVESYWIVSGIVLDGESVYARTDRYNYGPLWYLILGVARRIAIALALNDLTSFHITIATFLTAIDAILTCIIRRLFGLVAAICFFLHPVSILITGYHSQFDNLAIAWGFVGCILLDRSRALLSASGILGLFFLGLSLATKHILVVFSFWVALILKRRGATHVEFALALVMPPLIFGFSFFLAPWDRETWDGILHHVFGYASVDGRGIWIQIFDLIIPARLAGQPWGPHLTKTLFLLSMVLLGWVWIRRLGRGVGLPELLAIYLAAVVALSSAMADQYLAIPLVAVAIYHRYPAAWLYSAAALAILIESSNNLFGNTPPGMTFLRYSHAQLLLAFFLVEIFRSLGSRARPPHSADGEASRVE